MASPTQWTCVWVNSGSWWWTGRPGMLQFMESQRVGHDWVTELDWNNFYELLICFPDKSLLVISFARIFSHFIGCLFVNGSLCCVIAWTLDLGPLCSFLVLFLLFPWEANLRKYWYDSCQRIFCLWSFLGVLWCHVLFLVL